MNHPFLSIIIPLYNKEDYIESSINSVLCQSFGDFEIVVVNDGSTDDSELRVKSIQDKRIRLINQINHGVSYTRNIGIKEARGEWIMFLDADDRLLPDGLEYLINNIQDSKTIVAGNFMLYDGKNTKKFLTNNRYSFYDATTIYKALVFRKIFLRAGSFIIPSDFTKKHLYDTHLKRYEDMKYLIECFDTLNIQYIPQCIMCYNLESLGESIPNQDNWINDYGFHLPFNDLNFWKNCFLGDILHSSVRAYPTKYDKLKELYGDYFKYQNYARYWSIYYRLKNIWRKLFSSQFHYK